MNSETPISVVVPIYNHEAYIAKSISSVIDQSYERIELLLIDDHSSDSSWELIQDLVETSAVRSRFERIKMARNTINRGAHFSLNRGIWDSEGEYIFFLNSDDLFCSRRLELIAEALVATKGSFAFSNVLPMDHDGEPSFSEPVAQSIFWSANVGTSRFPSTSWAFLWRQIAASTGNFAVTNYLARKVGGFRPLKYCHDWDFVLRCALRAEPVHVAEPLYKYRLHAGNSFRSLLPLAEAETRIVVETYLRSVMTQRPANVLAPAPQNWPGMFYPLLSILGYDRYLDPLYRPYRSFHRTVRLES